METITPTGASVGTKQGFSIIKYTRNWWHCHQYPHGLTQAPDFIIVKNMDGTATIGLFTTKGLTSALKIMCYLNNTDAQSNKVTTGIAQILHQHHQFWCLTLGYNVNTNGGKK